MVIATITLTPKKSQKPRSAIRVAPLRHRSCRKNMMISALYQIREPGNTARQQHGLRSRAVSSLRPCRYQMKRLSTGTVMRHSSDQQCPRPISILKSQSCDSSTPGQLRPHRQRWSERVVWPGANLADDFPRQADRSGLEAGGYASSRTEPDGAERHAGIYGSERVQGGGQR